MIVTDPAWHTMVKTGHKSERLIEKKRYYTVLRGIILVETPSVVLLPKVNEENLVNAPLVGEDATPKLAPQPSGPR